MESAALHPALSPPPPEAVRAELEKILSSAAFVRPERLSRFLRFVVEKKLQGEADQIKEFLIVLIQGQTPLIP